MRESVRTVLEKPARSHCDEFLAAVAGSRKLHRGWVSPPATAAAFEKWLQASEGDRQVSFLLRAEPGGALAGVINVSEIVRGAFQSAYLGYYAFEPYAGRGYLCAGMRMVLRYVFERLRLHRVEANIQPDNVASIRLVRGLGMRLEGFSPRYLKVGGRWRDHERWALLAEEWRAQPRS